MKLSWKTFTKNSIETISSFVIVVMLLAAAASYQGKLLGKTSKEWQQRKQTSIIINPPTSQQLNALGVNRGELVSIEQGVWQIQGVEAGNIACVVNTSAYTQTIYGYGGRIPMLIGLDNKGVIHKLLVLDNSETPSFFSMVVETGLLDKWNGKTISEAAEMQVNAVSGATMSSNAIIQGVQRTMNNLDSSTVSTSSSTMSWLSWKTALALGVVCFGLMLNVCGVKGKYWRITLLSLNVIVLGFWCGQFISMSLMLNWLANGVNMSTSIVTLVMVAVTLVLSCFGKRNHHCNFVCPLGAAQELMGKVTTKKWVIPRTVSKYLNHLREVLLLLLMVFMWLGVGADIVNYEPFTAFLFRQAHWIVLMLAGLTLVLSVFINKPWCRYVCPTGQTLNWMYKIKY